LADAGRAGRRRGRRATMQERLLLGVVCPQFSGSGPVGFHAVRFCDGVHGLGLWTRGGITRNTLPTLTVTRSRTHASWQRYACMHAVHTYPDTGKCRFLYCVVSVFRPDGPDYFGSTLVRSCVCCIKIFWERPLAPSASPPSARPLARWPLCARGSPRLGYCTQQ
jgi:hypothetical protein